VPKQTNKVPKRANTVSKKIYRLTISGTESSDGAETGKRSAENTEISAENGKNA
jgi:hypothetical protein